ncbi:hypothetical protein H4R24_004797 [Coemansia sp. RSA 988]|nr:hypothetical protein H4R24_004797 [Coemansia sp. RSA 988]
MGENGRHAAAHKGESFYELAAGILQRLEQRQGSIKSLTIGNDRVKPENKRKVYALICQTLKYATVLVPLLERSGITKTENIDRRVALLQLHDLLLTKAGLQRNGANGQLNKKMSRHAKKLHTELEVIRQERGAECNEDLVPEHLRDSVSTFRYIRVNLLATTVDQVVGQFVEEGYTLIDSSTVERNQLHSVLKVNSRTFMRDLDLHDLLVFPPGTDLHAHKLFVNGSVVLQDKASCIPAHILQPAAGSKALDACAAPGNKTSHMASLMGNQGKIFAFERNMARMGTLLKLTSQAKCKIITAQCADFLSINPLDPEYADVEYALLDPSCSGSGIVNRMDALVDSYIATINKEAGDEDVGDGGNGNGGADKSRLHNLAKFQNLIILHAMRFPAIKRITYSTCSVHEEENEAVVASVLDSQSEFALAPTEQVIPTWPRRGLETAGLMKKQADSLVRSLPEDGTNGFFVAAFVRIAPADPEQIKMQLEEYQDSSLYAKGGQNAVPLSQNNGAVQQSRRQKRGSRGKRKEGAMSAPVLDNEATLATSGRSKRTRVAPLPMVATGAARSKGKKRPRRKTSVAAI